MAKCLFIMSIVLIFYSYFGYPLSLYILCHFKSKEVNKIKNYSGVSLIITAYNEEKRIEIKLANTMEIQYPRDKIQIIFVSDGSTDNTIKIAEKYKMNGIEIVAIGKRKGKENAQKEAVKLAKYDIIVFTDVATLLDRNGIEEIVSNFADPTVGCVSSEDRIFGQEGKPSGEGFYVRYEMILRRLESRVSSLVGLSGSFFAARKSVCQDFPGNMQSDFRTLLNSVKMGFRGVSDPNAIGYYKDIADKNKEFDRKVRTVLRGLTVFFQHIELLNIFKYGIFSYQYICHKLLRWLVPIFLIIMFFSNIVLLNNDYMYLLFLLAQITFYILAIFGLKRNSSLKYIYIKIPSYFLTVNTSIFIAWLQYLRGNRVVMWTPSER